MKKLMIIPLPSIYILEKEKISNQDVKQFTEIFSRSGEEFNIKYSKIKDSLIKKPLINKIRDLLEIVFLKYNTMKDCQWRFYIGPCGYCFYDGYKYHFDEESCKYITDINKKDLKFLVEKSSKGKQVEILFINIFAFKKGTHAFLVDKSGNLLKDTAL